ncbi:pre-rRNA-processing protein TSR1 homolog isoform X2 [Hemiscyllium ocellatum]|uniref:pre-rRNA-processing protein TSR1 homolog isoform X2 n=1 Tax=Hemiscyllium ocellatum TaxID=170820 RepID=UPI002966FBC6|nr:pre-rRNA-processing protein TSR1 homolog isoform X2 [Hemiscyllium ocellatum]
MAGGGCVQQERHRPGAFKQSNKAHKAGRHRTKGSLEREQRGRVSVKVSTKKLKKQLRRHDRRHHATQIRQQRREAVLAEKRSLGTKEGPPHLVGVIVLHSGTSGADVMRLIRSDETSSVYDLNRSGEQFGLICPRFKQRFSFIRVNSGDIHAVLDLAKVVDTLMLVLDPHEGWDSYGDFCLSCLFAQGLPSHVFVVQGINDLPVKKRTDAKRSLTKIFERRFLDAKLFHMDTEQDAALIVRHIAMQKQRHLAFRDHRSYLLAQQVTFEADAGNGLVGTLKVSGYIRGQPLNVNRLVHIVGHGDFQMQQIDGSPDPMPLNPKTTKKREGLTVIAAHGAEGSSSSPCFISCLVLQSVIKQKCWKYSEGYTESQERNKDPCAEMEEDLKVLMKADSRKQESLESEVVPDPMEGEQTWPTDEELQEAEDTLNSSRKIVRKVPKGTSDYQATWILDDEGDEEESDEDMEKDEIMGETVSQASGESDCEEEADEECETMTVPESIRDDNYDEKVDEEEEMMMLEKCKQERMDEMFPDEVDTPKDVAARVRFQKYRGLKSFRTSPWDPKENLPRDYARIFQFQNYTRTKRRIYRETEEEVEGAMMSVMHFLLRRHANNTEPIKSKEEMVFHCGCRRFRAPPLYSQHTSANKFKYERFFRCNSTLVGTVYGPITFSPASVLMFKQRVNGMHDLVATGSVLKADPDRIIVKRIILSGHPFKILNKTSVVRYMFFNREDVLWFKPVELRTKWGRKGHIKEPLGTHGHMKCLFDGQLKSQDTVLMSLYKRVFPKWAYDPYVPSPIPWERTESTVNVLEVEMD